MIFTLVKRVSLIVIIYEILVEGAVRAAYFYETNNITSDQIVRSLP